MLLLANLVRSRFGRSFRAVRDDEVAAQLSGIHVARTQVTGVRGQRGHAPGWPAACSPLLVAERPARVRSRSPCRSTCCWRIVLGGLGSLGRRGLGRALPGRSCPYLHRAAEPWSRTSPAAWQLKLDGNLPLAIFGLALIVVMIAAPGGIQAWYAASGAWLRGLVRRPAG